MLKGFQLLWILKQGFDSLCQKFGFGKSFIIWIEILLKDQLSCVKNGGTTTQYFNVERGAPQSDPIFAYLFILIIAILFLLIKKHPKIKGIEIFEDCFLYTVYTDDTMLFLNDSQSIAYLVELFITFSIFLRNKTKSNKM